MKSDAPATSGTRKTSGPGTLFVVATPIGNLEDITLRALAALRSADVIACEDTRRTRVLLDRHGIAGSLLPYHKFNEPRAVRTLVERLLAGQNVAVVTDGGTPAVSDPGYRLVQAALEAGATVTPLPGPCAFVAAVSASGLPSERILFHGFLPHRSGERRRLVESIRGDPATQVFYDSPLRAAASLRDMAEILGERRAVAARELTKRHESWYRGTLPEVAERVAKAPAKGEFCLVVEGASRADAAHAHGAGGLDADADRAGPATPSTQLREIYDREIAAGADRRTALKRAATSSGLRRADAYRLLQGIPAAPSAPAARSTARAPRKRADAEDGEE